MATFFSTPPSARPRGRPDEAADCPTRALDELAEELLEFLLAADLEQLGGELDLLVPGQRALEFADQPTRGSITEELLQLQLRLGVLALELAAFEFTALELAALELAAFGLDPDPSPEFAASNSPPRTRRLELAALELAAFELAAFELAAFEFAALEFTEFVSPT